MKGFTILIAGIILAILLTTEVHAQDASEIATVNKHIGLCAVAQKVKDEHPDWSYPSIVYSLAQVVSKEGMKDDEINQTIVTCHVFFAGVNEGRKFQ